MVRGSDTTVHFAFDGVDLTGSVVELWRKSLAEDPDSAGPLYSTATSGVVLTFPTIGRCAVAFAAVDVGAAGGSHYHLDAVKAGKRTVLAYGPLFVRNR